MNTDTGVSQIEAALGGRHDVTLGGAAQGEGRWYRLANVVMRRPLLVAIATAALLLLIDSPTPGVRWSGIDATVLPTSRSARVVQDTLAREFPGLHGGQTIAILASAPPSARAALKQYQQRAGWRSAPRLLGPRV